LGIHPAAEPVFTDAGRVLLVRHHHACLERNQAVLALHTPVNLLVTQQVQRPAQ
jgi:hypothetical protein